MAEDSVPQGAEMNQLRQEAIRRAREMQARAQIPVDDPSPPEPDPPPEAVPEPAPPPESAPRPRMEQMPIHPRQGNGQGRRPEGGLLSGQPLGSALDFLTKDPERAMIVMLMMILMEEKADNSLLFAMMYLMS